MRRITTFRAILLSLLLIFVQQAAQCHALDHLGAWLKHGPEQALHVPSPEGPCAVCALFAGGASAAAGETTSWAVREASFAASSFSELIVATAAPSSYLIRGPPALP